MKPIQMLTLLVLTPNAAAMAACHGHGDREQETTSVVDASHPVTLYDFVCDGKRYCHDFDYRHPDPFLGASIGVTECKAKQTAVLFGFWSVQDASSRPFEWSAEVRFGGVFPSLGHVGTNMGCGNEHPQALSPEAIVAADPDGFAWAMLDGDDVFIPLRGEATIDHAVHATAVLDGTDSASAPRVTVSTEEPPAPPSAHRGLGLRDSFPWGGHRATVVRVVAPQDGVLGAIGWVEVSLSDGAAPAGAL
jgi:hypothetical protein